MTPSENTVNKRTRHDNQLMSLDEARKVMWLSTNPKPMGELFDAGYLDQSRLEWAVAKAYKPAVRQAAQVLLNWKNRSLLSPSTNTSQEASQPLDLAISVDMSIEQARSTQWTMPPYRGHPMGELVDTKKLSLKDLGFAIESAWDEQVRRAATVLMLMWLNQVIEEPTSSGFLQVISSGRSHSERRQLFLSLIQGIGGGGILGAALIYTIMSFTTRPPDPSRAIAYITAHPQGNIILIVTIVLGLAMVIGAVLFVILFIKWMKRLDEQIADHRKGQEGEERVVTAMSQSLNGNWFLFRNVLLPGRQRADLDGVLVGPTGVWVLEIKNYTRAHRYIGDHWEYNSGHGWKPLRKSPSRQANINAIRLANFLRADGIQQWINPVVVWANPESPLTVENPAIPVWVLDRLPDELGNIWQGDAIYEATRQRIVDKLTKLCQRQEKSSTTS